MSSHDWPVLSRYEDSTLDEIAFPLGGIGTGTIALNGRGGFCDFEIMNRPAKGWDPQYTFFALWCQPEDHPPVTRVLEGVLRPPYGGGSRGVKATVAGFPRMRAVSLEAAYPFARYTLSDPDVPLRVCLEAFNPLIPLDVDHSSLPVAVLRYVLTNPTDIPIEATVAGSLLNFIGAKTLPGAPGGMGKLLGGNVNELRVGKTADGLPMAGLLMRSSRVRPRTPQDGTMALVALAEDTSFRRSWGSDYWFQHRLTFWDDLSQDGHLHDPEDAQPSPEGQGQIGSLGASVRVDPGKQVPVTFLICWHFAHRTTAGCGWGHWGWDSWPPEDEGEGWIGNYYTMHYADAWDVATQVAPQLDMLEEESLRFTRAFVCSTFPQSVKEAALNNLSTLRSQTCFRTADGHFYGFEGCEDDHGSCFGSCTHVWGYEQATMMLFPELARDMCEVALDHGTLPTGLNCFRQVLPLDESPWPHAAVDGQMGVVMRCYRYWQLSGDEAFLVKYWPVIKSLMTFCWLPGGWDANQDGVMEGIQHNTWDVGFYGPNPLTGVWYLGGLRAAEEMGRAVDEEAFAERCHVLYARGSAWIDDVLFNGEYYIQKVRVAAIRDNLMPELLWEILDFDMQAPKYQVGDGCLVNQLAGQYLAHIVGLGYLLKPDNVQTALRSLLRYNRSRDLYGHWDVKQTFALNDESALLTCTWPHRERPELPFPHFSEIMTGFEYAAAVHMIYEGLVDEGLEVVDAVRARFDGHRRNPWNECEAGHHYARAMASWSAILALSGFQYFAAYKRIELDPRWKPESFRSIWTLPSGWGEVAQCIEGHKQSLVWRVFDGKLIVQTVRCGRLDNIMPVTVTVNTPGDVRRAHFTVTGGLIDVSLATPVTVKAGQSLSLCLHWA